MTVQTDRPDRTDASLVTDPADLPATFARAFNAGDLAAVDRLFEPDAVRVLTPGVVVTGDGRRGATSSFLQLGIPIVLSLRHTYVCGDLALLIGDYLIDGVRPDGEHVHFEGTATDVARRGADGHWRYVIDNPPGTDREAL
jgi:ketosteroid isomerase-like protein